MALRLSKTLGRTPESWLAMQENYNLWQARQTVNLEDLEPLAIPARWANKKLAGEAAV
jgi:antitoxin HigA-1